MTALAVIGGTGLLAVLSAAGQVLGLLFAVIVLLIICGALAVSVADTRREARARRRRQCRWCHLLDPGPGDAPCSCTAPCAEPWCRAPDEVTG